MPKSITFLALACLAFSPVMGQNESPKDIHLVPTLNMGFHVNLDDFFVDAGIGAEDRISGIGMALNFAFRPYYKKVQIHEEGNIIRQWKEKKYYLSFDLYKRLVPFSVGNMQASFILGGKTGYLFGDYLGTKQRPKAGITFCPFGGLSMDVGGAFVQLSYLYFSDRLATVPDGRLMFTLLIPLKQ